MIQSLSAENLNKVIHDFSIDTESQLKNLPDEMLAEIYKRLNCVSQSSLRLTSQLWQTISCDHHESLSPSSLPKNLNQKFTKLHSIDLKQIKEPLSKSDLEVLAKSVKLKTLELPSLGCFEDVNLSVLTALQCLENLYWSCPGPQHQITGSICQLPNSLITLEVCNCDYFDDQAMNAIANLKELESLNFSYCSRVSTIGLNQINALQKLQTLIFVETPAASDEGLSIVCLNTQLRALVTGGKAITNQCLTPIGQLKELRMLGLLKCRQLSLMGLANLTKACVSLRILSLADTKIKSSIFPLKDQLKSFFHSNYKLTVLDLAHTGYLHLEALCDFAHQNNINTLIEVERDSGLNRQFIERYEKERKYNIFTNQFKPSIKSVTSSYLIYLRKDRLDFYSQQLSRVVKSKDNSYDRKPEEVFSNWLKLLQLAQIYSQGINANINANSDEKNQRQISTKFSLSKCLNNIKILVFKVYNLSKSIINKIAMNFKRKLSQII